MSEYHDRMVPVAVIASSGAGHPIINYHNLVGVCCAIAEGARLRAIANNRAR
jgi:hypothetical protein